MEEELQQQQQQQQQQLEGPKTANGVLTSMSSLTTTLFLKSSHTCTCLGREEETKATKLQRKSISA